MQTRIWIYICDPFGSHLGLESANGRLQGVKLAIDIAVGDRVAVDKRELADSGANERLA